jgi:peptidyl-prolyl cis-trans isomerase C
MRTTTTARLALALLVAGAILRGQEEPVTAADLLEFIPEVVADYGVGEQLRGEELKPLLGPQIQALIANGSRPAPEQVRAWAAHLAEAMINQRLVLREALRQGARVDLAVGKRLLADQEERLGRKAFKRALQLQGVTAEELGRHLAENEAVDRWLEAIGPPPESLTDHAAEAYYNEHPEQFHQPAVYHVAHLLIAVPADAEQADAAKLRERIAECRQRLASGEAFAAVATQHSDCPSKAHGGDLGPLPCGRMPPEFESGVMSLAPGQISEPVRTPHGWHLIRGGPVTPASQVPFASVREPILARLRDTAREKARQDLIRRLREQAHVSLYLTAP